jgi:hypothetical protein
LKPKQDLAVKLDLDYDAPENKYNRKKSFWSYIPLIGCGRVSFFGCFYFWPGF